MQRFRDRCVPPPYNRALGTTNALLLEAPPFTFPGVTARFFPLQASVNLLSSFYQSYLNVEPEICIFKPSLPWAFLVVLDYGRMASEATNLGWISQQEIFFAVPLEEWRRDSGGRWVFRRWVLNTPFIFVDNSTSITVGREVYGWPKVMGRLLKARAKWLKNPNDATRLLRLDVEGFGDQTSGTARLLDIDQRLNQNMSLLPLDFQAVNPLNRLSRWLGVSLSAGLDMAEFLVRSPFAGFGPDDPEADREVLSGSLRQLFWFLLGPEVPVVTLKQFPDARDPSQVCYESLVQSKLGVARYNRGGLLGLPNVLQGEVGGGFRIRLHQQPAFPIVESLGLKVARERTIDGNTVSILKPVLPFWVDIDLSYGKADAICWRLGDSRWFVKTDPVGPRPKSAPYNTFAGGGQQVWSGPFLIPRAYLSVFPLRTDEKILRRLVQRYLNHRYPYRFEPWGSYVYLAVSKVRMFSKQVSAAWIDAHQIAFVVPLLCQERDEFIGTAAVMPFVFCDNPTLTMTQQEVQGVPAIGATIRALPRFWRRKRPPMLKMRTDVFTALDQGLESRERTVLEVVRHASLREGGSPPHPEPGPVNPARPKTWDKLSLQMLSLKQFRDADDPDRACYQALVLQRWLFSKPRRVERLKPVAVKIFRYPNLPLTEKLGLLSDSVIFPRKADGAIADVFYPEDPFRIELPVHIGLAEAIARTAGSLPWIKAREEGDRVPYFRPEKETPEILAGPQALLRAFLDQACPDPETC